MYPTKELNMILYSPEGGKQRVSQKKSWAEGPTQGYNQLAISTPEHTLYALHTHCVYTG